MDACDFISINFVLLFCATLLVPSSLLLVDHRMWTDWMVVDFQNVEFLYLCHPSMALHVFVYIRTNAIYFEMFSFFARLLVYLKSSFICFCIWSNCKWHRLRSISTWPNLISMRIPIYSCSMYCVCAVYVSRFKKEIEMKGRKEKIRVK